MATETAADMMQVQLCVALPDKTTLLELTVSRTATIADVIAGSDIATLHPEIDAGHCQVGVFGKLKDRAAGLYPGDRVELYRALQADPMDARRRRAKKQERKQQGA